MGEYTLTRRVVYERERLFALVSDIERYPEFVPGYRSVFVHRREDRRLYVTQTVSVLGWTSTFDSVATLDPPRVIRIETRPSGFRFMEIVWSFDAMEPEGTCVGLVIRYEAGNILIRAISERWVQVFSSMQLHAFLRRAEETDFRGRSSPTKQA